MLFFGFCFVLFFLFLRAEGGHEEQEEGDWMGGEMSFLI